MKSVEELEADIRHKIGIQENETPANKQTRGEQLEKEQEHQLFEDKHTERRDDDMSAFKKFVSSVCLSIG